MNGGTDDGDDVLEDSHGNGAVDEEGTTTKLLNGVEGDRGGANIDNGGDHRDQKWIAQSNLLEEGGVVVEDEIDTSPLLEHLQHCSDEDFA